VNVREDKSEFTKYSFPSKTIEYMLSGTPLLTTRLIGIPQEYYRYSFSVSSNTPTVLMEKLKEIAEKSAEELLEIGRRAQRFIQEEKNGQKQAKKIEEFVLDQIQRD
ncbi:MAG: glycosyl transferase family 1, partial [Peptococcaceae bacterium]|nr:glycosyl transferase family 1 [Peptococcaceae bacterium]